MQHYHVVRHSGDDDPFATYDLVSALDYASTEIDRMAESAHGLAISLGATADAAVQYMTADRLVNVHLNLSNMVTQASADPTQRAMLYRDEPQYGPRWQDAVEHAIADANALVGDGFALYACGQLWCRPGAWVIVHDGQRTVTRYGAADFYSAVAQYKDVCFEWADKSDEDFDALPVPDGEPREYGSDQATVAAILADDGPYECRDHAMTIRANDGTTTTFELIFDAEEDTPCE